MDLLYNMVTKYSSRTQLSFMYCIWTNQTNFVFFDHNLKITLFKTHDHLRPRKQLDKYWINSDNPWVECFDPYENRKYFFNTENRLCKWDLDSEYSEEHYRFLEIGYKLID